MSERALLALTLLVGATAPLRAQDLAQLRRHEAELTQRLAVLEAQAASADSTRFVDQKRRIITVAPLVVALPEWVSDDDKQGLEQVVAARRERYGSAFDALLAELQQASADHFGADPETVLWGEAAWLSDATAKLKDVADQHFRRGEYAA